VILPLFYGLVAVLGVLSMGFQLLASRLLSPHFGSSIIVWAWLISTFLAAFSLGSLLGGWISNRPGPRRRRAQLAAAGVGLGAFALTAAGGAALLDRIELAFADINAGLCVSCLALFFVPVAALSSFGPQSVQYLAGRGTPPGAASGLVYGVSTVGNIAGVMLTAFALIPHVRVSVLLYLWLAAGGVGLAGLLAILWSDPRAANRP